MSACPFCDTELPAALADYATAMERIRALHKPKHGRPITCSGCRKPWPCPTTRAAIEQHGDKET